MKNVISFVVVVLSLCLGHAVRADEPYRLQMLGADALSIGLVVGGAYAESAPMVYSGFAVGAFGAPVVHFSNGHATRGLWSMGVRLLAPIAGIALGIVLGPGCDSSKSEACVLSGLGNAMVGWWSSPRRPDNRLL